MAIYDCFTFFNEIDILKIRLEILSPYVDRFIIVESPYTFRGEAKKLHFKERENEFEEYKDKIIYVVADNVPQYTGIGDWGIEIYQRNMISSGLYDCNPNDIVVISDVDEIPNIDILKKVKDNSYIELDFPQDRGKRDKIKFLYYSLVQKTLFSNIRALKKRRVKILDTLDVIPLSCEQDLYYYYMNCKSRGIWYGSMFLKYKNFTSPQQIRNMRNSCITIKRGGWHFSYLGGVSSIQKKLKSIIDTDPGLNRKMQEYSTNDEYIESCISKGIDIYGRKGKEFEYNFIPLNKIGIPNAKKISDIYPDLFRL